MSAAARFFSYLFHPLFAPLICLFILFELPIYINYKLQANFFLFVYGVVAVNLIIAPLLVSLHLKKRGYIESLNMPTARQRIIPYLISAIFYVFTYFLFERINFPFFYLAIYKASCLTIIVLLIAASFNYKISAHLSAIGGIIGVLILVPLKLNVDTSLLLIVGVLIAGVVASSRLILKAHSGLELFFGFLLGLGLQLLILL